MAGYKGVDTLPSGYEVTLADVRGTLAREDIAESDIKPGDALLFSVHLHAASPEGSDRIAWSSAGDPLGRVKSRGRV